MSLCALSSTASPSVAQAQEGAEASQGEAPGAPEETAEQQAASADALRRGRDWLAIPVFEFNEDEGFVYGVKLELVDFKDGEVKPYAWNVETKLQHSTTNRHQHRLQVDIPKVADSNWRVLARADFLRIDDANYFGLGNDTVNTGDESFHQFRLTEPRLSGQGRYSLGAGFFLGVAMHLSWTLIEVPEGRLLTLDAPVGIDGGRDVLGLVSLGYDTRDDELVPTSGIFAEVYTKGSTKLLGSSFSTFGLGATAQGYVSPLTGLVLAQRLVIEHLGGDVPFYDMQRIGVQPSYRALGGVYSQRGYLETRFIGPTRALSNSEVRVYFPPLFEKLFLGVAGFLDVSRVIEDDGRSFSGGLHPSGGGGFLINWKDAFVFRMDYGVSNEDGLFYIEGRHMF